MVFRRPGRSTAATTAESTPRIDTWGAFCQLYLIALSAVTIIAASQIRRFLPERFLLDGIYIEQTLQIPDGTLPANDPFRNIAMVYRLLGLAHAPDAAAMLALAGFSVAMFAALRWEELPRLTLPALGVITVCYALALIYLAQYSKEFASLGIVLLVLLLPRSWWAECLILASMVGYAVTIRPYWAVVACFYLAGRVLLPRLRGLLPVLLLVFLAFVSLQVVFNVALHEPLTFQRVAVNAVRADVNTEVGSLIVDFLPADISLQAVNAFLVFASLALPWPLLLGRSVTYLVMAVVLCVLWGLVAYGIVRMQREHHPERIRSRRPGDRSTSLAERVPRPHRAAALLLGLLIVQAIFEPDYGSYVKHLTPMLPLFCTLLPLRRKAIPPTDELRQHPTEGVRPGPSEDLPKEHVQ